MPEMETVEYHLQPTFNGMYSLYRTKSIVSCTVMVMTDDVTASHDMNE